MCILLFLYAAHTTSQTRTENAARDSESELSRWTNVAEPGRPPTPFVMFRTSSFLSLDAYLVHVVVTSPGRMDPSFLRHAMPMRAQAHSPE